MTLILDTSVIIDIEKKDERILEKMKELIEIHPTAASITFINYFEFIHGLQRKSPKNKEKALAFIEMFDFLEPTKRTATILSDLKYKYEKHGQSFSLTDLLIASQSIENDMTLVTGDKHFQEIEELKKIIL